LRTGRPTDQRFPRSLGLSLSPDSSKVAAMSSLDEIMLLDAITGKTAAHRFPSPRSLTFVPRISSDGRFLLTGDHGCAFLFDVATGARIQSFLGPSNSFLAAVAFSEDSEAIVVGWSNGSARLYQRRTGDEIRTFSRPAIY